MSVTVWHCETKYKLSSCVGRLCPCELPVSCDAHLHAIFTQMVQDTNEYVNLYVREKKKWKKCPCVIRATNFIQFKDSKVYF